MINPALHDGLNMSVAAVFRIPVWPKPTEGPSESTLVLSAGASWENAAEKLNSRPTLRCNSHYFGDYTQRLIRIEESHSGNRVVDHTYHSLTMLMQFAGNLFEIADRQSKSKVLCSTRGMLLQIVVKHTLPRKRLHQFDKSSAIICLGCQPFSGYNLTAIRHVQVLRADEFRFREANSQRIRNKFNRRVNIRHYPADLCQFKFFDGVVDTVHL